MALVAAALLLLLLLTFVRVRFHRLDPRLAAAIHRELAAHRQALDLSADGAHFDARLVDPAGKRIFLLGESHGVAVNEDLDFAMLRYLHRVAGVRVYLPEMSYAQACLWNLYLEEGDEHLLDFLFAQFRNTALWTREHRDFMRRLRQWNLTLDRAQRIQVLGVDIEHQPRIALRFLSNLVRAGGRDPAEGIRPAIARMEALREAPEASIRILAPEIVAGIEQHHEEYAALLGDRLADFAIVARNLERSNEFYDTRNRAAAEAGRERAMYDTFRKLYARISGAACYGRWGADHTLQRPFGGREPFAAMLERPDSPVAGQIASIQPIYQRARGAVSNGTGYQEYDASAPALFLDLFAPVAQGPLTLFRITGAASLFNEALPGYPLGDGAQYVVLIRDAGAAHSLEPGIAATSSR